MGSLCIINGAQNAISETFIQAHIERLNGPVVVLNNSYPEYKFEGRAIRYFYHERPWLAKLQKLLPQFLYHRLVTRSEFTRPAIHGCLAGFFREHQVDCILAEYGFNGADIFPHARDLGIPLIVHFHGHDAHRETDIEPYRERFREMFNYAYRIISVSRFMTEKLIRMGADPSKIVYNPYGPREYFFENEPDYRPTLLAVGRFADIKAPYLTLMAFKEALQSCPNAHLMMVGDGPLHEMCKCLAKMWGMEHSVTFTGALRHDQVSPLCAKACAFVQHSVTTSYGDAEGTPVAILEAQAAALPVISTRHSGIADAVVDSETGFLVEERDVHGMASAMVRLLSDPLLSRRMGMAAREHIRRNFPLIRHIERNQSIIDAVRNPVGGPVKDPRQTS